MSNVSEKTIVLIGLGYVGLPLAVEFGKKYKTIGFDISKNRVDELSRFHDSTRETTADQLKSATRLKLTCEADGIKDGNFYIITVPTPVDKHNRPDLTPIISATRTVGKYLKSGDIVVYESTVYPGCTEEECVPVLERESGLKFNKDFFCGYSPERINPGDKEHTVTKIKKVTSGSTAETADIVDELYRSIIVAGTFKASSIKVAEAAKVIENTQRDINIAFVNELSQIFRKVGIDTHEVLDAAGSKWNFLNFRPGLVGGHCIGVDPYYLTHKAQELGHNPEIILAGRRLNDNMGAHVAEQVVKGMIHKGHKVPSSRILVLGITFKENCPDIRNSKVVDVINGLKDFGCTVDVHDPLVDAKDVYREYGIELTSKLPDTKYDAIVLAVGHSEFKKYDISSFKSDSAYVFDVRGFLPRDVVDGRL